jgi:hypothetical protein
MCLASASFSHGGEGSVSTLTPVERWFAAHKMVTARAGGYSTSGSPDFFRCPARVVRVGRQWGKTESGGHSDEHIPEENSSGH